MRIGSIARVLATQLQIKCAQSKLSEGLEAVLGTNLMFILHDFEAAKSVQHLSMLLLYVFMVLK